MKILNWHINFFWILVVSLSLKISGTDELSQDYFDEEPEEEAWIEPDEEQEIKVLPPEPIQTESGQEERVGLTLNVPIIGAVTCYTEVDPKTGQEVLTAHLPGKSINLSPIPIYFDTFEIIIPEGKNPTLNANALLFGKKAKVELLEAKKTTAFKETPIQTKSGKKVEALSADLSSVKLRILFEEKPTLTLFPGKSLDLNHIDLLLELDKKFPVLETEINVFGHPIDVQFGFTLDSATVDFSIPSTQFSNIIPFVQHTPLANANLKTVIVSAKYLYAKKSAQRSKEQQNSNLAEKETVEQLKQAAESTNIGSSSNLLLAFSAQADLSAIIEPDLKNYITLNDLSVNATFSEKEGFRMESSLKDFSVPLFGTVSEAKLIVDWSEKKEEFKKETKDSENEQEEKQLLLEGTKASNQIMVKNDSKQIVPVKSSTEENNSEVTKKGLQLTIALVGNGAFNIPVSGLGQLKYSLNAQYANNEFSFGGKVNESFSYNGVNIAADAEFLANVSKKIVTIAGTTDVNGLNLIAKLMIAPDEKTKGMGVSITTTAKATDWKPLENIDGLSFLPDELKNITIKNLDASFIAEKKASKNLTSHLVVKGLTNILNIDVNAQVNFVKNDNQTGIFLKADVPNDKLPGAIEKMQIKDAAFVLSTMTYEDPETKVKYQKGLNLIGKFDFTGDLETIGNLLHLKSLDIVGVLDPTNIQNSKFSVKLPGIVNTGTEVVSFGPLTLEITGQPSFSLVTEVTIRPDKRNELLFRGSAGAKAAAIAFELSMFGLWKNPFNLISEDFAIGNGHVGFSFMPLPPPAFVSISSFAFGGETMLSKAQDIKFIMSIDLQQPQNLALLGSLEGKLTLEEFMSFIVCKVINQKMNIDNIPDISMEEVKVSFALADATVGAFKVEQGITLKGIVSLFGEQLMVDFEVKRSGAKAQADMSPINLGPLKISSGLTEKGEKRQTKLGGPSLDIELSTDRQQFLLTGMLDLAYIFSTSADISISRSGLDFNFQTAVGPDKLRLFMAKVSGHSSGPLSDPDFNLHMEMEQNFINYIKEQIIAGLRVAQDKVQAKINEAISNINSIDKKIAEATSGIEGAKNKVEEWKNKVRTLDEQITNKKKEIDYYKSKISGGSIWGDIGDTFKKAGNKIGDIATGLKVTTGALAKQAIQDAKNLAQKGINEAEKQANKVVYAAKIVELGTQVAALETAKGTALITLKGFQEALDKIANPVAVGTLEASKRTAQAFLSGLRSGTVQILKAGEWTVKSFAEGFNVQKIVFDGSLKKIENGKLPGMLFVITILGSEKNIDFDFDFKDVATSASNLAQYIAKKFVPGI